MRRKYEWEPEPGELVMSNEMTKRKGLGDRYFIVTDVCICDNDTDENGEVSDDDPPIPMQQMLKLGHGKWSCLWVPFPAYTVFPWREKRQR